MAPKYMDKMKCEGDSRTFVPVLEVRARTEEPLRLCPLFSLLFPQAIEPFEANRTIGQKQSRQQRTVGSEGVEAVRRKK